MPGQPNGLFASCHVFSYHRNYTHTMLPWLLYLMISQSSSAVFSAELKPDAMETASSSSCDCRCNSFNCAVSCSACPCSLSFCDDSSWYFSPSLRLSVSIDNSCCCQAAYKENIKYKVSWRWRIKFGTSSYVLRSTTQICVNSYILTLSLCLYTDV